LIYVIKNLWLETGGLFINSEDSYFAERKIATVKKLKDEIDSLNNTVEKTKEIRDLWDIQDFKEKRILKELEQKLRLYTRKNPWFDFSDPVTKAKQIEIEKTRIKEFEIEKARIEALEKKIERKKR
jgi:hypothetical protein